MWRHSEGTPTELIMFMNFLIHMFLRLKATILLSMQFSNVSNAEHTVCVRMCAYIRPRDWAVRSSSRYIQHLCGDGVSPLPHRPPPTPSDKVWLKGHAWLCRYLHQHVGVMVSFLRFLFFCIVVLANKKSYSLLNTHLTTKASFVVWLGRRKLKTLLNEFYSFPLIYFWVTK